MPQLSAKTLRSRFGYRAFVISLAVLGVAIIGTGLFWRARLMGDLTDGLAEHIASVESDLETLDRFGQFPPRGTDPYVLEAPEHGVQVLSLDGEVLAASRGLVDASPAVPPAEVASEPGTTVTTITRHETFGRALAAAESFTIDGDQYAVEALTELSDVDRAAWLTFGLGPVVALAMSAAIGLGVTASIDRALRPVRAVTHRAAEIASGRRPMRLDVTADTSELRDLTTQLDKLLDAIRASFDREQAFLDDATHELRTPIAIARTELELALRTSDPDPEMQASLRSAIEELDRVERTASELLVLARARSAGEEGFAAVDLGELARRAADRLTRDHRRARKDIAVEGAGSVMGDEPALERALINLMGNAVDHADSAVQVEIGPATGNMLDVIIQDDGPGFPPHLLDHLFDRFARGEDRRAQSTGLGTAIAAEIITTHGGTITASNRSEGGAVISIRLPSTSIETVHA